ncbi:MAG: glycosyltransferase [Planctomycetota bacterium]
MTAPSSMSVRKVAYVVNRYPGPSHSFVRREILGLEAVGCQVQRFSVRPGQIEAESEIDRSELESTSVLLDRGVSGLLLAFLMTVLTRPLRLLSAMRCAASLAWRSDVGWLRHGAYLLEACLLLRRLDDDVELLHAHFGTNSTAVAMLASQLGGPPFSFTAHGPEEFERSHGIALGKKVRAAAFVVAISDYGRSQLWRFLPPTEWQRVVIARCGVDATFLADDPEPPVEAPVLLWIGRLVVKKGVSVLLDACRVLKNEGLRFKVQVVGGGELADWLGQQVAKDDLGDCIELLGWQNAAQIRAHLDASRGLVMSSFAEGLPVVLMESMARARTVIAPQITGIPELVVPGENGYLVTSGRVDMLADAMRSLLTAPVEELLRLGRNARARVEVQHDANREAIVLREAMTRFVRGGSAG